MLGACVRVITQLVVMLQMRVMASSPWKHWRSWTGVWISLKRCRRTDQSVTWPPARYATILTLNAHTYSHTQCSHSTLTLNAHIQHSDSMLTLNTHIQRSHSTLTLIAHSKYSYSTLTFNANTQRLHSTLTLNAHIQRSHIFLIDFDFTKLIVKITCS